MFYPNDIAPLPSYTEENLLCERMNTLSALRQRLWLWGHPAGAHNHLYNLSKESRMTPTEAALYLGIPNICMVCYGNEPKPPFDRECIAMSPMQKVIWSIVGDSSCDNALATFGHLEEILRLSEKFSNIHGAIFDDFFAEERRRLYTPQVLTQIRERLRNNPVRPLDMWLVLYDHQLTSENQEQINAFDGITFWTWSGSNLEKFRQNFASFCSMTPGKRRLLGCYLYNYGEGSPFTREDMSFQLNCYLEVIRKGEADGIIFLSKHRL